jgi:hypothetical protein
MELAAWLQGTRRSTHARTAPKGGSDCGVITMRVTPGPRGNQDSYRTIARKLVQGIIDDVKPTLT